MDKKSELRLGESIGIILVVVNAIEFWLATGIKAYPVMMFAMILLALIDIALILEYYMHVETLFHLDEGGHS
jgi:heme/copper-type cytochrome/quinol oxidase subunit 4